MDIDCGPVTSRDKEREGIIVISRVGCLMRNRDVVVPPARLSVEQGQKQEVFERDPEIVD